MSQFQSIKSFISKHPIWTAIIGVILFGSIFSHSLSTNTQQKRETRVVQQTVQPNTTTEEPTQTASVDTSIFSTNEAKTEKPTLTVTTTSQYTFYPVTQVVDGDTIKINMNGTIETLRLIGMDTPETVDPRKPVQCFGKEASNKAKELLSGKKVRIETDQSQGVLDKYGRTLAYVFREDGLFYNKYMIEQGYAHEYTYNKPYKYQSDFKASQKSAQSAQLGLWSPDTCNGNTSDTASSQATTQTTSTGKWYTSSYHTSVYYYPEACNAWQGLSTKYIESYDTLQALLFKYPTKTQSPQCQ